MPMAMGMEQPVCEVHFYQLDLYWHIGTRKREKRGVEATHEPLVDTGTFDAIQKAFPSMAYNEVPEGQPADNILKGKVVCGCCGGKMQHKRGTNHADWYFFICITKNHLGNDKCTGIYAREEDVFNALYQQLKLYVSKHYIMELQHKHEVQQFSDNVYEPAERSEKAWTNEMECCEQYVRGELNKEEVYVALDAAHEAKAVLAKASEQKADYDKKYSAFLKPLSVNDKRTPIGEIMGGINKIVVDTGRMVVVK